MSDQDRDLYKWSDVPTPQQGNDGGQATQRFRDEVYDPHRSHGTPREAGPPQGYPPQQYRDGGYAMQQRQGDNVNNIVVYGDLYINQGGDRDVRQCQRQDGRTEYYGRGCDYTQYCDPRQRQAVPYQEYGYRQQAYVDNYYDRANYQHAWQRGQVYEQPSGPVYEQRGPQYSRDSVQGGRDGYSADRERYNGGSTRYDGRQAGGYYQQGGCFPTGGGGAYEGGSPQADGWDRAGQIFDFALRGFDAYAGHDIARRYAKNDGRRDYGGGGGRGGYDNSGRYNDRNNRGNMGRAWQR